MRSSDFKEHPARAAALAELHARPAPCVEALATPPLIVLGVTGVILRIRRMHRSGG